MPDDDDDSLCGLAEHDGPLVVGACACRPCSDLLCNGCADKQECPVLEALQAPDKNKSAMPRMTRPNQKTRIHAPLTAAKIANVERRARRGKLHLPPLAQMSDGEWEIVAPPWRSRT